MSIAEKLQTIAENEQKVYKAGQQSEYDRFWDEYQNYGAITNYDNYFSGKGWTKKTFRPKYNMSPVSAYMMFRYNSTECDFVEWLNECGISFDDSKNRNTQYMYFGCLFTRIGTITFANLISSGDTFGYCSNLHTIDKIISTKNVTYSRTTFIGCEKLVNITFDGEIGNSITFQWSPLTAKSAISAITHLKNYSGTDSEFANTLTLSSKTKTALEAEGATSPNGNTWAEYIKDIGWNLA